jgi:excisionase family DNA binding protein
MTKKYSGTAKPPRAKKPPAWAAALPTLQPIDHIVRATLLETCAYLKLSLPMVYRLIQNGELESFVLDGKRWVTPASIKRRGMADRPPLLKAAKFQRMRRPPVPGRAIAA